MKRIMVTGAGGFAGSRIAKAYKKKQDFQVFAMMHRDMELGNEDSVLRAFEQVKPDFVFHAGAISDTGICEREPELSYKVNVLGVRQLAKACGTLGTKLIFFSSDQVYSGSLVKGPHMEDEILTPSNVYGRHKLEAEAEASQYCPDCISLRLSWMYDLPYSNARIHHNFLTNIMKAIEDETSLLTPVNDYRGITYVNEVVDKLESLFTIPGGVYNFGSENDRNTFELTREICLLLGGKAKLVVADQERYQENPRNLCMNTEKLKRQGIEFLKSKDGILKCLSDYKNILI